MKLARKRIISLVMAVVLVFSLFVGTGNLSATEDAKGESGAENDKLLGATPTDAEDPEEITGVVRFEKTMPKEAKEVCNMAGIQYGIYKDESCSDLVTTIVLSYDGHVYRDGDKDEVYRNEEERGFSDDKISGKELTLELPVATYFYKEKKELKDSSLDFESTGYQYSDKIGTFSVEDNGSVMMVKIKDEWNTVEVATPADAEETTEATTKVTTEATTEETTDATTENITADTTEATTEPVIDTSSEFSTEEFTETTTEVATPGDIEGDTEEDTDRVLKFAVSTFSLVPMMMARVSLFASSASNYVRRTTTSYLTPQMILQDSNGKDVRSVYCGDHNKNAANYYKAGTKGDPVTLNTYGLNSSNSLDNVGNANVVKTLYHGYKNGWSFTALRSNLDYYRHGTANGNMSPAFNVSNLSSPTSKYDADITMETVDAGKGTLNNKTSGSAEIKEIGVDDLRYKTIYTISKNLNEKSGVKKLATEYYTGTGHKLNGLTSTAKYNRTPIYKVNSNKNSYTIKVPKNTICYTTKDAAEKGVNSCTWTSPAEDTSVIISGGTYFMFVAKANYQGKSSVTAKASKDGFVAYVATSTNPSLHMQTLFAAELYEYSVSFDIDWETDQSGSASLELSKVPSDGSTSWDYNYYNMAGIRYEIQDKDGTKVKSSNHKRKDNITVKAATQIVLSYNGKSYMDESGYNIIFVSPAAKEAYKDNHDLYTFRWYKDDLTADTTYYYKEASKTSGKITTPTTGKASYYYDDGTPVTQALINKLAGKGITETGFMLDASSHSFTLKKGDNVTKVVEKTSDNKISGSISLQKFVNNVKGSAAEGIIFKLYYVPYNGATNTTEGAHKIGEFTVNASGDGVPTLITTWATNCGASTDGTNFNNLPLGWYYIYEMGSSVDQLGFVNDIGQRTAWTYLGIDGAHATFSMNNTTDGMGAAIKKYDGGYDGCLYGVQFGLYKVDYNGDTNGSLIGTFEHNGTSVVPLRIEDAGRSYGIQISGNYFTNLPYGWYCLIEDNATASARGFSTSAPVYLECTKDNKIITFELSDVRSGLRLKKQFEETPINKLCNYGLDGAEYTAYTTTGYGVETTDDANYLCTFRTDTDGNGYVINYNGSRNLEVSDQVNGSYYKLVGVPLNTWVCIREITPSAGCNLDPTVYYMEFTEDNMEQTCFSIEPLKNDPIGIQIKKEDSTSGSNAGAASLAGAEFTVRYYDVDVSGTVDKDAVYQTVKAMSPTRTWVYKTVDTGEVYMSDPDQYLIKDKSDELYYNSNGESVFPYGVITIEETKAPDGYTRAGSFVSDNGTDKSNEDGVIMAVINDDYTAESFIGTSSLIKKEEVLRADLKFKKVALNTNQPLSGIAFKITSKTTGESHVVVTDANGMIDTSKIKHSENTNAADTDSKTIGGTWFYGNKDGNGTVDDTLGALPFDTYEITEIATDTNTEYRLITPITVDLTKEADYTDGYQLYDLGTVTNIPEPYIGTRALGVKTQDNIIPANEKVDVEDITSYYYLEAGKTFTVKGIIMDSETKKPYVQPDGTYSMGHKIFTVPADASGYTCADVKTPFVIDTTGLDGKDVVVAEYLYEGEDDTDLTVNPDGSIDETNVYKTHTEKLVKHDDLTSKSQTLSIPKIGTTALGIETETHYLAASGIQKFKDIVDFTNVIPNRTYKLDAVVMDQNTGEPLLDVNGEKVTAFAEFTPSERTGSAEVIFTCDASNVDFRDKATVIFEDLSYNNISLAVHKDLSDTNQQLFFPGVSTKMLDTETGEHKALYGKNMKFDETVSLTKLPVGTTIKVVDELHNAASGDILKVNGKSITEEKTVTVTEENMSVLFSYKFDATKADLINKEGTLDDIVAFVHVYDSNGNLIASEEDKENKDQTITLYTEKTDISVEKVWDDNNNEDLIRPENVVIQLYKGTGVNKVKVGNTVVLSENNNWKYTWKDLKTQEGGKTIQYSVDEVSVPDGYTKTIESNGFYSFVVKNYHKPDTTEVKVTKIWEDNNDKYQIRPKNIQVQLYKGTGDNRKAVGDPVTLDSSMNWEYTWSNLDKKEDNGEDISYSVDEIKVPAGYTKKVSKDSDSVITSYTIKNSKTGGPKTGDAFKMIPVFILMGMSLAAIIVILIKRRKK